MLTRKTAILSVAAAALLMHRADLGGQALSPDVLSRDLVENSGLYFVELASAPIVEGTSAAQVRGERAAFRRAAAAAGIALQERFEYETLFNGLSIRVNRGRVSELSRLAGVRAVYPVEAIPIPETMPGTDPQLFTALAMTGADIAQSELGLTGRGIRVAVMDTGVDYHHPDLGGCFGPGCRVERGYDFVGDAYDANPANATYNPLPVPDPDPDDCNGHGTHVAGIVGADGGVRGVAPGVTFAAYRVFGCEGSTDSDIMVAAMERAHRDRADVLNMSIGASFQWPQYPTAQAADRLVRRGMVVVASAGNSGTSGLYAASAPSVGERVISVASFDNTHETLRYFTVSGVSTNITFTNATGAPPPPTSGTFPLARTGTPTTPDDACAALPAGSLAGKVALIRRGTCSFYVKAFNAQSAGAIGVILYNNAAGRVSPTVAGVPPITIPVVAILQSDGIAIDAAIAGGPATMTWTDDFQTSPNPTGNTIASSSSYGPAPDLSVKPDLAAPGGSILSTYPLERGGYSNVSGTSMASPHVAGAAALLLEARPHTRAEDVRAIFQASADPRPWWGNPSLGLLDQVHRQGAGMLDIDGAILEASSVTPGRLALGESQSGPATRRLTIENDGPTTLTYTLSHAPALATGPNTFSVSALNAPAAVSFSATTVTVRPRHRARVDVTITPHATLPDRAVYGGYIVVTPSGGGAPLRVPYTGFKGDYQAIPVLTPVLAPPNQLPWLARVVGTNFVRQSDGAVFTLAAGDLPRVVAHFDHASRRMRIALTHVPTGVTWPVLIQEDYLPRNSTAGGVFEFPWDGTLQLGSVSLPVPDGDYRFTMTVLKALGDEADPAHTETWVSPFFTIDRP